jgi:hypothetical protein
MAAILALCLRCAVQLQNFDGSKIEALEKYRQQLRLGSANLIKEINNEMFEVNMMN